MFIGLACVFANLGRSLLDVAIASEHRDNSNKRLDRRRSNTDRDLHFHSTVLTLLSMKRPLTILPIICLLLLRDNIKNIRIFQITALMLM